MVAVKMSSGMRSKVLTMHLGGAKYSRVGAGTSPATPLYMKRRTQNMRARAFAVAAIVALPLGAIGVSAQQGWGTFRNMDRNNDGFITQAEWRGSAREFRTYDRNNDGRLT